MNRSDFRQSTIGYYGDVSSVLREGQKKHFMRCEDADHPANQVDCSGAKVYIGRLKNANCDEYRKFVAFIDIGREDGEVVEIISVKTKKECTEAVCFGWVYSQHSPSVWYRAFREFRGYDKSRPLQTEKQKEEGQNRGIMALAAMAGAFG
mgnify:CR=1 FL=1|jgi:hypothetical protein